MSVNLMDLAKGYLDKQMMSQIGGILGESPEKTESAIGGALPALIGGFMKKASTGSGVGEIIKGFDDQDDSILDNLGDILGGGDLSGLMSGGSEILKMLFAGGLGSVFDLLTKSTGLGTKSITSLLGLLAPIVMSVIKRQFASGGLDAAGLTSLLGGQKDFIASTLPSGMGDMLGLSSLGADVSNAADRVAEGVSDAGRAVASGVGSAAEGIRGATNSAAGGGSMFGKLLPLIALLALALITFQIFRGGDEQDGNADGDQPPVVELEEAAPSSELNLSGPLTDGAQSNAPADVERADDFVPDNP